MPARPVLTTRQDGTPRSASRRPSRRRSAFPPIHRATDGSSAENGMGEPAGATYRRVIRPCPSSRRSAHFAPEREQAAASAEARGHRLVDDGNRRSHQMHRRVCMAVASQSRPPELTLNLMNAVTVRVVAAVHHVVAGGTEQRCNRSSVESVEVLWILEAIPRVVAKKTMCRILDMDPGAGIVGTFQIQQTAWPLQPRQRSHEFQRISDVF